MLKNYTLLFTSQVDPLYIISARTKQKERVMTDKEKKFRELKREFKKHYRRASKLKEGGKAWQREIDLAADYLQAGTKLKKEIEKEKYGG